MNGSPPRRISQPNGGPYTSPVHRGSFGSSNYSQNVNGQPYRGSPTRNGSPTQYYNGSPTRNGSPTQYYNGSPTRNGTPVKSMASNGYNYNNSNGSPIRNYNNSNGSPVRNGYTTSGSVSPGKPPQDVGQKPSAKPGILQRFSNAIISTLENFFYRLGKSIGTHPIKYMIACIIFAGLCGIGIAVAFTETTETNKLWAAEDSEVISNLELVEQWFPSTTRISVLLVKAPNILVPAVIQNMYVFYDKSTTIQTPAGDKLADVCVSAGPICLVNSLLELWKYNETIINSLTQDDILDMVNTVTISPTFRNPYDITTALGIITRNETGHITGAQATKITWLLKGNDTMKPKSMEWETKFVELGGDETSLTANYFATRSFGDEAGGAIQGDVTLLSAGYFVLIIYVAIVIGRFNHVEQGIYLALSGILCVGLSICVSFGLSSAFGLEYGPLHSILPFLLLGIGVDDMFVIIGSLNNLNPDEKELEIPERMGHVLKHAGLSVTVTSLTDIVAFGIGATTTLPALKSFCGFAALGILGLFVFQVIFFTATLALDQKRRAVDRNACCCCYVHKNYTPNSCSQRELLTTFFTKYYAPFLLKLPVKIVLFIVTLALFGVNVYGVISLKQEFDSNSFIPQDSYAFLYLTESQRLFESDGQQGSIYCGNIDYFGSQTKFNDIYTNTNQNQYNSNGTTSSWHHLYTSFLSTTSDVSYTSNLDGNNYPVNEGKFVSMLNRYVYTEQQTLVRLFKFANATGGDILASQISFKLKNLQDSTTQIAAMDSMRKIVADAGFQNDECFAYARSFLNWETNKIIKYELYRNLGLAFACVFVVTLILIANLWTCLMVSSCIIFTLVNVGGSMHFWGLTIETVTSILLILAIGLAVDYSAHIGHTFMTIKGTRQERALQTLSEMGPPVFNGGFSTFLAFVLLAGSNSYVFTTFFQVFFLVVAYGLFHGLVYLPIILSWLGPSPYLSADHIYHHDGQASAGNHVDSNGVAMTNSSQKPYYSNNVTNNYVNNHSNKAYMNDDGIETIYIPPPDYTPPTTKRSLPRVGI